MNKFEVFSSLVLRAGIGLVIMWFGFQQLLHPESWTGFLPDFLNVFPITKIGIVYLNGWFEVFASLLMIMGIYVRITSALLIAHLLGIVLSLGYNPIAIRDIGLTFALLSIFLRGQDQFSFDKKVNSIM